MIFLRRHHCVLESARTTRFRVLGVLVRELQHEQLDQDPLKAARFVIATLDGVGPDEIGAMLDATPRTIRNWLKPDADAEIRKADRVILVAQIVYDLRNAWTPRGIVRWLHRPMPQLGDRSPLHLLDEDVLAADEPLRSLARGARGQLAS